MNIAHYKYIIDDRRCERTPNLGDASQTLGLESFLHQSKVPSSHIKSNVDDSDWYDDDRLTLVIGGPEDYFRSRDKKIKPLFVGALIRGGVEADYMKRYLKNYGLPFLCRDRWIASMFRKDGYEAIRWGCPSLLFPRREPGSFQNKVFYCDIPSQLLDFIPEHIKVEMIDLGSQDFTPDMSLTKRQRADYCKETARHKLLTLRDNARLVITSRLHIAAPCLAMGIPVIMADDHLDTRRMVLEPFIPLYRPQDFRNINWSPVSPDIENVKKLMADVLREAITLACAKLESEQRLIKQIKALESTYPPNHVYLQPFPYALGYPMTSSIFMGGANIFERIIGRKVSEVDLLYYGLGHVGRHFYAQTEAMVRQAKSFAFVDNDVKYEGREIDGYQIIKSDAIVRYNKSNLIVVVTANGFNGGVAQAIANDLTLNHGLWEGEHMFLYEILMASIVRYSCDLTNDLSGSRRAMGPIKRSEDLWKILS